MVILPFKAFKVSPSLSCSYHWRSLQERQSNSHWVTFPFPNGSAQQPEINGEKKRNLLISHHPTERDGRYKYDNREICVQNNKHFQLLYC